MYALCGLVIGTCGSLSEPMAKFGTAIAAIRVPSEVVIATDSRVVDRHGRRLPDECKIRVVQNTVYTAHGMSTHSATGLDVFALVSTALRSGDLMSTAATAIARLGVAPLSRALSSLRQTDLVAFKRAIGGAVTGVILGRYEAGAPHLASVRFLARAEADEGIQVTPEIRICPGPDCADGRAALWVSPGNDRLAFQSSRPDFWKEDLPAVAAAFVQGEIDKGFADVGPPIDVIRIVGGGILWVQRQNTCSAEE